MEKGIRAFFYDYKYYLFPDGVCTLKELKAMSRVDTKRLKEVWCMAPDFVYESIADESVEIESDKVFEVFVNLYSREEYDAILREQVNRVCPGCEYYEENDDPSLNGHHHEIALNGTCYIRQDKNADYEYSDVFDWFWKDVSEKLNELAECIDKNDQTKLNKILNEQLKGVFFPTEFFGAVIDGKYTLCMTNLCGVPDPLICLHEIMAACANGANSPINKAGWNVLPYRPAGLALCNYDTDTPIIRIEPLFDGNELPVKLSLYHPRADELGEAENFDMIKPAYDALASIVGEPILIRTVPHISSTSDDRNLLSVKDAAKAIKTAYVNVFKDGEKQDFPPRHGYMVGDVDLSAVALPFRQHLVEGQSKCLELSCLTKESEKAEDWWKSFASFAYIVVPLQMDDPEYPMSVLNWYIAHTDRIPEPMRNPQESRLVGTTIGIGYCGEDGYVVDNMIISEKAFFRKLKALAPVLKAYRAKVVIVNYDGIAAYDCDYEFAPIDI